MSKYSIIHALGSRLSAAKLPLRETAQKIIHDNSRALEEKLSSPSSPSGLSVWDRLTRQRENQREVRPVTSSSKSNPPSASYYNFLKSLYPSSTLLSYNSNPDTLDPSRKYSKINHDDLFEAYQKLPSPPPLFIRAHHLEDFLKVFLDRRDFKYGHPLLNSRTEVGKGRLIAAYKETLANRRKHVARCSSIMNDIRKAQLPLSMEERNKLIGMSLFKDKQDIIAKVEHAIELQHDLHSKDRYGSRSGRQVHREDLLQFPKFEWDAYQSLLQSFEDGGGIHTETYNTILFAAIRHNNHQIVQDIYGRIYANGAKGSRKSLGLFLKYFASQGQEEKFFNLIANCSPHIKLDSVTLDIVIEGLLSFHEVTLAEKFVKQVYFDQIDKQLSSDPDLSIYKNLNVEDDLIYTDLLYKYDKAVELLSGCDVPQFKLFPTENTFYKFLQYYTQNAAAGHSDKITPLLASMDAQFELPITTRIYKLLFQNSRNIEDVQKLVSDLLKDYELSSSSSEALTERLASLPLTPKLRDLLLRARQTPAANLPSYLNNDRMNVVKLSKDLMNTIFEAYLRNLHGNRTELVETVKQFKTDLLTKEAEMWGKASSRPLNNWKEVRFLRRAYLIELLDFGFGADK